MYDLTLRNTKCLISKCILYIQIIQNVQHYTTSELETAALAANAGICLEGSIIANNTFTKLGDAVNNVNLIFLHVSLNYEKINYYDAGTSIGRHTEGLCKSPACSW